MNKIVLTDAGIAELINAEQTGTAPVTLTQVGLGTGKYDAAPSRTALAAEFKRLATISGGAIGDNVIHLFMTDASSDAYTAYEVGIYTQSGTLLGVVSSKTEPIVEKAAGSTALLAIDFVLTNADPASVTVGDTTFVLPPATTEMQGIVELATPAETIAGTDNYRAVTPYALAQRTATAIRKGLMRFATVAESETGTNTDSAVTPAGLMAVAAKYLPLAGGTMTGSIVSSIYGILKRNNNTAGIIISGGSESSYSSKSGALLFLYGASASANGDIPGAFRLTAMSSNANPELIGKPDGTLTWNNSNVITAAGGTMTGMLNTYGIRGVNVTNQTVDANDLLLTGINETGEQTYYSLTSGGATNISNIPTAQSFFMKSIVSRNVASNDRWAQQFFFTREGEYVRNLIGTTWGAWSTLVRSTRTINNKALSANITLTPTDVGAVNRNGDELSAIFKFGTQNIPIRLTGIQNNIYRDICGHDTSDNRVGGIRFTRVNNNTTNQLNLYVCKPDDTNLGGVIISASDSSSIANINLNGVVTNPVVSSETNTITSSNTSGERRFNGGTDLNQGGSLIVYGKDNGSFAGQFRLRASDGTTISDLIGTPAGSLTWRGSEIIRAVGGTFTGNVSFNSTIMGMSLDGKTENADTLFGSAGTTRIYYTTTDGNSANISNLPNGTYTFTLISICVRNLSATDRRVHQICFQFGRAYTRENTNGTWSSWREGAISSRIDAVDTVRFATSSSVADGSIGADTVNHNVIVTAHGATVNGASLVLSGSDNPDSGVQGSFNLSAKAGTAGTRYSLVGYANGGNAGKLLWGGSVFQMNGTFIRTNGGEAVSNNIDTSWIRFNGGTGYNNGGSVWAYGKDNSGNAGWVCFRAHDGTNSTSVNIRPNSETSFSRGVSVGGQIVSASNVSIRNGGITRGTAPSANQNHAYSYEDKNGNQLARLQVQYNTAKRHGIYMEPCNDSGTFNGLLGIFMDAAGTAAYTQAPTPAQTDDSTKIATTAYVKDCVPKSIGSSSQPVYTNANGVITACTMNSSSAAGLARITNQAFGVYSDETHRNGFSHGYVKFASGLIIQWGCIYRTNGGTSAVTFETAYVNKPQITFSYDAEGDHTNSIREITNTGFVVSVNKESGAATVKWIAIGI